MNEKQYYRESRVSSSSLKWFKKSPLYFKKVLDEEIKQIQLKWFDLGKQVHMAILEPELFEESYITMEHKVPTSANQKLFCENYMTNGYNEEEAYEFAYTIKGKSDKKIKEDATKVFKVLENYITYLKMSKDYRDVLPGSKWNLIHDLKKEALSHKKGFELLVNDQEAEMQSEVEYFNEKIIMWKYPNGLKCKSMLDRFIIDHKNKVIKLVDIKTSFDVGDFREHFKTFEYHRQLAFYWQALHYELKELVEEYTKETYIITLQTKDLPECRVFSIDQTQLDKGNKEINTIMNNLVWHYKEDSWQYHKEYYTGDGAEKIEAHE
jgi:hypothetical protein